MLIPPTVNGLRALSVRLSIPWRGVWVADIELDLDLVDTVALLVGPAVLVMGTSIFNGTFDERATGQFGDKAHCRVVGGRNGWDKEVVALHFNIPGGVVLSSLVYAATAAEVLELPPLDPIPKVFQDFARTKGAASRVFGDRQWFVEPTTGIAIVNDWPPLPPDPLWTIIDFDIGQQRASIASDSVVYPGMVVVDTRFGAELHIIRDVEQIFDSHGSHADVWFSKKPCSRLQEAFSTAVRELGRTAYLKTYKYRFVLGVLDKLILQAITPGAPDLNPISQWTGLSGITASLAGNAALFPATEIVVGFAGGDATDPYLVSFSPLAKPLGITLDALTFVNVGIPTSPAAKAVGTLAAIAALQIEVAALGAYVAALTAAMAANPAVYAPFAAAMVAPGAAAATAMVVGAVAVTAAEATVPSPKLFVE